MASPSDPVTESESLSYKPIVSEEGQGSVSMETAYHATTNKTLNLESTEDFDGEDQKREASIEENWNEEEDDIDGGSPIRGGGFGGSKRKKVNQKKRKFTKQAKKSREKLKLLRKTLNPVAFVPGKTLDFTQHEKLLKTLGIWEFLHLEFDQNIRRDLLAELIAFYSPELRCSYVMGGSRININRADLARALNLPKLKDMVFTEEDREVLDSDESVKFVEEILGTWVLLQRDDMWIMPVEVVEWGKDIKEKRLEKLDWAALLWFMVEKELKAEPPLGDCFFASHMQMMIKTQKPELLKEKRKLILADDDDDEEEEDDDVMEVDFLVKSPKEDCLEVKEEDVGAAASGKDDGVSESKEEKYVEEHTIELNLGQETVSEMVSEEEQCPVEEQSMDVEENKKEEDDRLAWSEDTHAGSHFLRRCDLSSAMEREEENKMEFFLRSCALSSAREREEENKTEEPMEIGEDEPIEDVGEEEETEEDKEKHEGGFPLFPNGDSLHGVGQENLMLGDASPLGYGAGLQIHGNSTGGDFLPSRVDMHMGMGSGSSSLFGNGHNKRQIDHENDLSYHSHNPSSKRLRTEEPSWDDKPPAVEMCIEQIEYWTEKARLSCAEKEQERDQSIMNQQYLMRELENKAEMIQDLERTKFEEQQRKDSMIYRLENELRMMANVVEGYKKALKETRKASKEHRKRCPLRDDKPVYKDVKGSGGLVLSTTEIDRLRIRQEAEDRITRASIERQVEEFESDCLKVFERHMEAVELLDERLIEVENEVNIQRETLSEIKNHEALEVVVAAAATEETSDERLNEVENEVKIGKETLSEIKNHEALEVVAAATEETSDERLNEVENEVKIGKETLSEIKNHEASEVVAAAATEET